MVYTVVRPNREGGERGWKMRGTESWARVLGGGRGVEEGGKRCRWRRQWGVVAEQGWGDLSDVVAGDGAL